MALIRVYVVIEVSILLLNSLYGTILIEVGEH